jgi:hypothetical protein
LSTALCLFQSLCDVGNALAHVRDTQEPCGDTWTALTCILLTLDASIDTLVRSNGLGGADDDVHRV